VKAAAFRMALSKGGKLVAVRDKAPGKRSFVAFAYTVARRGRRQVPAMFG
jgi:hypothetical protein